MGITATGRSGADWSAACQWPGPCLRSGADAGRALPATVSLSQLAQTQTRQSHLEASHCGSRLGRHTFLFPLDSSSDQRSRSWEGPSDSIVPLHSEPTPAATSTPDTTRTLPGQNVRECLAWSAAAPPAIQRSCPQAGASGPSCLRPAPPLSL